MSIPSARADGAAEPVAYATFLKAHPEYDRTNAVDALRASDYRRLDAGRHVYLDYTGGGLHAESQVRDHGDLLNRHVFGNPHSANLTSSGMTTLVEQCRHYREAACVVGPLIAPCGIRGLQPGRVAVGSSQHFRCAGSCVIRRVASHSPATHKGATTSVHEVCTWAWRASTVTSPARRRAKGLSQEQLAEQAELHWTYISGIERGQRSPTLNTLGQLARALGLPVSRLVSGLTDSDASPAAPSPKRPR